MKKIMFSKNRKAGALGSGWACINVQWLLKVMSTGLVVVFVGSGVTWGQVTEEDINEVKTDIQDIKNQIKIQNKQKLDSMADLKKEEERIARKKLDSIAEQKPSLNIIYNAREPVALQCPPPFYQVDQKGSIVFEVRDINLFRYNVSLTEIQRDMVSGEKVGEDASSFKIDIDPSIFDIESSNFLNGIETISYDMKSISGLEEKKENIKNESEKISKLKQNINLLNLEYPYVNAAVDRLEEIDLLKREKETVLNQTTDINEKPNKFLFIGVKKTKRYEAKKRLQQESEALEVQKKSLYDLERSYLKLLEYSLLDTDVNRAKNLLNSIKSEYEKESGIVSRNIFTYSNEATKLLNQALSKSQSDLKAKEDDYYKALEEIKKDTGSLRNYKYSVFNQAYRAYVEYLPKLNELIILYKRLLALLYSDQSFEDITKQKYQIAKDMYAKNTPVSNEILTTDYILKNSYQRIETFRGKFLAFFMAYQAILEINDTEKGEAEEQQAKTLFDKVSAFNNSINQVFFNILTERIGRIYDAINETNFTLKHETLILSDKADAVYFSLNAEPHKSLHYSWENKPINFQFEVGINGGVKIDGSAGTFFHIGLDDYIYNFKMDTTRNANNASKIDTTYSVVKSSGRNVFIPSLGALIHVYKRTARPRTFKPAGSFGISTDAQRLNYYLGASAIIGRSERVVVTAGLVGGQMERAVGRYDPRAAGKKLTKFGAGKEVNISNRDDLPEVVPVSNRFRIGAFLGITYNLSGKKSKEFTPKLLSGLK